MQLHERVAALESTLRSVVDATNQNFTSSRFVISNHDIMMQVLQRVVCDMVTGKDPYLTEDGSVVDYPRYISEFYGVQGFSMFIQLLKASIEADKVAQQDEAKAEFPEEARVFGG